MTKDQVFVPKTRSEKGLPAESAATNSTSSSSFLEKMDSVLEDAPLYVLLDILAQQLLGWPLYLTTNITGQRHYPKWTNHFNPSAIMFDARHRSQVIISNVGLIIAAGILTLWGRQSGFGTVFKYYLAPYIW